MLRRSTGSQCFKMDVIYTVLATRKWISEIALPLSIVSRDLSVLRKSTFFQLPDLSGQIINLVMARPLALQRRYSSRTHISVVNAPTPGSFITFALEDIYCNVLYLQFTDELARAYVCEFPNCLEVY